MSAPSGRSPFHGRAGGDGTTGNRDSPLSFSVIGGGGAGRMSFGTTASFVGAAGGSHHWTSGSNTRGVMMDGGSIPSSSDLNVSPSISLTPSSMTLNQSVRSSFGSSRNSFGVGAASRTPTYRAQEGGDGTSPHVTGYVSSFHNSFSNRYSSNQPHFYTKGTGNATRESNSTVHARTKHTGKATKTPTNAPSGEDEHEYKSSSKSPGIELQDENTSEPQGSSKDTSGIENNSKTTHSPKRSGKHKSLPTSREEEEEQHLRALAKNALHSGTSPTSATFYAGILLTRTGLPSDALLYAKALAANDEGRRAILLLERSGLLLPNIGSGVHSDLEDNCKENGHDWNNRASTNENDILYSRAHGAGGHFSRIDGIENRKDGRVDSSHTTSTPDIASKPPPSAVIPPEMYIEASLLAAKCLASTGEWEEACTILEEACRFPPMESNEDRFHRRQNYTAYYGLSSSSASIIEDGDDPRIAMLARHVRPHHQGTYCTEQSGEIHPVARLCCARGRAYDELSNPVKASSWLKAALRIDAFCVEALDHLLERHLLNSGEERDLVYSLRFGDDDSQQQQHTWLQDMYIARLSGGAESALGGPMLTKSHINEVEERADRTGDSHVKVVGSSYTFNSPGVPPSLLDASSIHHHTPSTHHVMAPTPSDMLHSTASVYSDSPELHADRDGNQQLRKLNGVDETSGGHAQHHSADLGDLTPASQQQQLIPVSDEIDEAFYRLHHKHKLGRNSDVLAFSARRAFSCHRLSLAASLCQAAHEIDPLCPRALFVHAASLVSLRKKRELFHLAHRLVEANPRSASGWFAVGCYYQLCAKYDIAQRHFCRATRLEPRCAEAWIGFGCAFASADESDQALAAYRAAQRLYGGSHYPLLYMGMEYLRTNHLSLAGHFLGSASRMNSDDPLSFNELGVCVYRQGQYEEAVRFFLRALRLCAKLDVQRAILARENKQKLTCGGFRRDGDLNQTNYTTAASALTNLRETLGLKSSLHTSDKGENCVRFDMHPESGAAEGALRNGFHSEEMSDEECISCCTDSFWEPTVFNLGQSYRKIRYFEDAALCFEKSIALSPGNAASYAALGFTKHLTGNIDGAIESYHQALSIKPDDTFSGEMLNRALQEAFVSPVPFLPDEKTNLKTEQITPVSDRRHYGDTSPSVNKSLTFLDSSEDDQLNNSGMDEGSHFTLDSSDVEMSMT